jgi:hypothetical protein
MLASSQTSLKHASWCIFLPAFAVLAADTNLAIAGTLR